MALCDPEDTPAVEAAAIEFVKVCHRHGLEPERMLQAGVAAAAAAIAEEAKGDLRYALELAARFHRSLRSAVKAEHGSQGVEPSRDAWLLKEWSDQRGDHDFWTGPCMCGAFHREGR